MRRTFKPLTPEMMQKIRCSSDEVSGQKSRFIKCPYCNSKSIRVFEDTRGHVQTKCKVCGKETVFDVLSMRKPINRIKQNIVPELQ